MAITSVPVLTCSRPVAVGIRADVRYFRGFEAIDDEDPVDNPLFDQPFAQEVFNFWRGTIGVTFRFGSQLTLA